MKHLLIALSFILLLQPFAYAIENDAGYTYNSKFEGKQYKSVMPVSTLKKSKDLDLTNKTLPMSLSEIIKVAYTQLTKITGTENGWEVSNITLNNWRADRKKWFYAVSFEPSDFNSMNNITILVTIDGQLGIIKEVKEKIVN